MAKLHAAVLSIVILTGCSILSSTKSNLTNTPDSNSLNSTPTAAVDEWVNNSDQVVTTPDEFSSWQIYTNAELGFEFRYPSSLGSIVDAKVRSGTTGKAFGGFIGERDGEISGISFGGRTADFTEPRGGNALDTLGYKEEAGKYYAKWIFNEEEIASPRLLKTSNGRDKALIVENQEVGLLLGNTDTLILVNLKNEEFPGIGFQIFPITPENKETLEKIVSTIHFISDTSP